jgi:hypothetical protein
MARIKTAHQALMVAAVLFATAGNGVAGLITFSGQTGQFSGTGIGSVFTIITLQEQGNGTTEGGSVAWNGSADVITPNPAGTIKTGNSQTQTQLASDLSGVINQNNIVLVLQVNQNQGGANALNVNNPFTLNVFNNAGTIIDSATFTPGPPNSSTGALAATGQGTSGYIFNVTGLLASDFTTGTNRFGLSVGIMNNANDGNDTFFLANGQVAQPVPAPATLVILASGLPVGFFGLRRRLRRQPADVAA